MAAITTRFGTGGSNLTPAKSSGVPDLATALRDVADDLAALKDTGVEVSAAALAAFTDPPSAAEMALLRTLVNELRAKAVSVAGVTLLTTKV